MLKIKISQKQISDVTDEISANVGLLKIPLSFKEFVIYSLHELTNNVIEHSGSGRILVKIEVGKRFFLHISDNGIGIKKSYQKKKLFPKDDFSAIEYAVSGLSTKSFKERGFGLFSIKKMVYALNGELVVRTGKGEVLFFKSGTKNKILPPDKAVRGTSVLVSSKVTSFDFYKYIE